MSDIFISYASEDRERTALLAKALQDMGWSVWWDRSIPTGKTFVEVIKAELEAAKCAVVVWSRHSVVSQWVQREARLAADQRKLFPVLIEDMAPPWEFSELQACNLANWAGETEDPVFQTLVTDLRGALTSPSSSRVVEEPPRETVPTRRSLAGFLRTPVGYGSVGAALTAALGLFAPDRLIPEPLQGLRPVVSLYVAATFVLAWAWRASLRSGLKRFATITFLLALVFAGLNLLVVRPVTYSRGDQAIERHFLTGLDPVRQEDAGQSAEDLIKTYGDGWSDLVAIWGGEYAWIAAGYAVTYLGLILGIVLSVSASDPMHPGKRP
ncbi:MAG TPA: toll/interleukin-1 receptor domain-containing protein [Gemmatimonadales bacterium]|nr:toll/interleukin-1 receptor domain-containing protein [Gemmatimonadales bacterium]